MPKCLFINNDGSGFADYVQVPDGTTVQQFFTQRVPHGGRNPSPDELSLPA